MCLFDLTYKKDFLLVSNKFGQWFEIASRDHIERFILITEHFKYISRQWILVFNLKHCSPE